MRVVADTPRAEEGKPSTNPELHHEAKSFVDEFDSWFQNGQGALTKSERAILMTFLWWATRER